MSSAKPDSLSKTTHPAQPSPVGMRAYEISRYRSQGEPPQPGSQLPASSQPDSYSQVPKTHRVMTLADHISVRNAGEYNTKSTGFTLYIHCIHLHLHKLDCGFCRAAYHNPGLCPESGPSFSFCHIPERGATHVFFKSSQGAQPLQS